MGEMFKLEIFMAESVGLEPTCPFLNGILAGCCITNSANFPKPVTKRKQFDFQSK